MNISDCNSPHQLHIHSLASPQHQMQNYGNQSGIVELGSVRNKYIQQQQKLQNNRDRMRDVLVEKMGNNSSLGFKGEGSFRKFNMYSELGEGLSHHGHSIDENSKGPK